MFPEGEPPLVAVERLSKRFPVSDGGGRAWLPWLPWARGARAGRPKGLLYAVDDVSLTIDRGESVGLVGESGCGKSTLARAVARLIQPTSGRILLEGRDLAGVDPRRFARSPDRSRIQLVFQDATDSLNPRWTAFEAIADPLRRLRALAGEALAVRVRELADQVALPRELLHRFPHQLSGGQKARVGIARAIGVDPELLVLDEPTAALDVSVQAVVLQLLGALRERLGISYLFVTHDLSLVRLLCDRVIVMYLGRVVEEGSVRDVFARPRHPYTRALLAAVPGAAPSAEVAPVHLEGEPRSPIDPDPHACGLLGRCPLAVDRCARERPELQPAGSPRHQVACHLAAGEPTVARSDLFPLTGISSTPAALRDQTP
jgi:oligopeptide/dipeptide ABC transporter ATP-binding protein